MTTARSSPLCNFVNSELDFEIQTGKLDFESEDSEAGSNNESNYLIPFFFPLAKVF